MASIFQKSASKVHFKTSNDEIKIEVVQEYGFKGPKLWNGISTKFAFSRAVRAGRV